MFSTRADQIADGVKKIFLVDNFVESCVKVKKIKNCLKFQGHLKQLKKFKRLLK